MRRRAQQCGVADSACAIGIGGGGAYSITVASSSSSQAMFSAVLALAGGGVAIATSSVPRGTHLGSWSISQDSGALSFRLIAYQFDSTGKNTGYLQVSGSGAMPATSIKATYTVTFVPNGGTPQVVDQGTLSGSLLTSN